MTTLELSFAEKARAARYYGLDAPFVPTLLDLLKSSVDAAVLNSINTGLEGIVQLTCSQADSSFLDYRVPAFFRHRVRSAYRDLRIIIGDRFAGFVNGKEIPLPATVSDYVIEEEPSNDLSPLVVYHTRYNHSKELAEVFADGLGCKSLDVMSPDLSLQGYEHVCLVFPMYFTHQILPVVSRFVKARRRELSKLKVSYLVVCGEYGLYCEKYMKLTRQLLMENGIHPITGNWVTGGLDFDKLNAADKKRIKRHCEDRVNRPYDSFLPSDLKFASLWGKTLNPEQVSLRIEKLVIREV